MSVRRVAVIFPHADAGDVELFRRRWDPPANSVAAHITVVFPFEWHGSIGALETVLGDAVLKHPRFPVRLNGIAIWEDEYLFLLAREGPDEISRLHHDLYAGLLPGLAAPRVFVPHMTVGRPRRPDELLTALGEANSIPLSVDGLALALSIYRIEPGGRRVRELDVPLPSPVQKRAGPTPTRSRAVVSEPKPSPGGSRVGGVDTQTAEEPSTTTAERLRHALVDGLSDQGKVPTGRVEQALRTVPRHLFVPAVSLDEAYANDPVYTKHDPAGVSISAASQPAVVAMMLEQLQVEPGHRVLEIGAGTGYNAALLAHLVGADGDVTTIDIDDDIVHGARSALDAACCSNVRVIHGDGALGYPDGAPYDRVIATVGAFDVPPAWLEQTGPNGRIVVPMRLRGSVTRSVAFERENGHWRSRSSEMCGFMPLRGLADDARHVIDLAPDGTVALHVHQEQTMDPTALAGVLEQPRYESWTGVQFGGQESFEWLWLWLTCTMGNALSRMIVQQEAKDRGLVTSATGLHIMATTEEGNLAYLTLRPAGSTTADAKRWEVGVIGHGIRGEDLANQVALGIRAWNREYRCHEVQFSLQPSDDRNPITGQFAFRMPRNRLIISWR